MDAPGKDVPGLLAESATASPRSRRAAKSGALSLAIHGGLAVALIAIAETRAPAPPRSALVAIDVVEPPALRTGSSSGGSGPSTVPAPVPAQGRRAREVAKRVQVHSPVAADPRADFAFSYDSPTEHPVPDGTAETGNGGGHGLGLGIGTGTGDGAGNLPPPPRPRSLARDASPRHPYLAWGYRAPPQYRGKHVLVDLAINATGDVTDVRVLEGLSDEIDAHAVATAKHYQFFPALDVDGQPIACHYHWEFQLVGDHSDPSHEPAQLPEPLRMHR